VKNKTSRAGVGRGDKNYFHLVPEAEAEAEAEAKGWRSNGGAGAGEGARAGGGRVQSALCPELCVGAASSSTEDGGRPAAGQLQQCNSGGRLVRNRHPATAVESGQAKRATYGPTRPG
jgi:hypothetical protein